MQVIVLCQNVAAICLVC